MQGWPAEIGSSRGAQDDNSELSPRSGGFLFGGAGHDAEHFFLAHALTRDEMLAHAGTIVGATDLPVSADLGNGFGDAPETVAETIRLAAAAGLLGCTIEDTTGKADHPLYDFQLAVERIAAAAEAVRGLPFPFMLTARAHNLLFASPKLDDTISRLQAFEKAGADVLFAPGLADIGAVRTVCAAVAKPFNFMKILRGRSYFRTPSA